VTSALKGKVALSYISAFSACYNKITSSLKTEDIFNENAYVYMYDIYMYFVSENA